MQVKVTVSTKAIPSHCHAIRQSQKILRGIPRYRGHQNMAATLCQQHLTVWLPFPMWTMDGAFRHAHLR